MDRGRIGISLQGRTPAQTLELIETADSLGVPSYWLPTGGVIPDALTLFAAAATRTRAIKLGTAILPTFPRHPLVVAQQAQVVASLAPGRLVVGVGPSHQPTIAGTFGLPFERPLEHLREYVTVLKAALQNGEVDFDGARIQAHARTPSPAQVPVMISALRASSFRLAGAVADGAISWVCPAPYLRDVALPALRESAAQAGRDAPPLVGHCFVALTADPAEAARSVRPHIQRYPTLPFYAGMFVAAGFPEAQRGELSEAMFDAVVVHGDEAAVADGLRAFFDISGANELIASFVPTGPDARANTEQAMRLIAGL